MKFLTLFLLIILISNKSFTQDNFNDNEIKEMIKEFYLAHQINESHIKILPPKVYDRRLDSIQKKYCTLELRNKAKKFTENGIDFLTNDNGIDQDSFKTMMIIKDVKNKNTYLISYDVLDSNYPKKPMKRHVNLRLGIVFEDRHYKIASVK